MKLAIQDLARGWHDSQEHQSFFGYDHRYGPCESGGYLGLLVHQ